MRLVCARSHPFERPDTDRVFATTVEWLEHLVIEHAPHRFRRWLLDTGFLDAPAEWEVLRWRWDYWNAHAAAMIREDARRRWEAKAAAARARWGEGASPAREPEKLVAVCARCGKPARNLLAHFDCSRPTTTPRASA